MAVVSVYIANIGVSYTGVNYFLDGSLSDVRIYSAGTLVRYYKIDEDWADSSTDLIDYSGSAPLTELADSYIDLDNFKVYSDRYGYKAGSDVLARVGQLLKEVIGEYGSSQDLVGHIGGDDYVVLSSLDSGELLAQKIIAGFTLLVPSFYNAEDREAGSFAGEDRYGVVRTFSLMTISIAVIASDHYDYPSRLAISQDCARVKEYLKIQEGSNYMLETRN